DASHTENIGSSHHSVSIGNAHFNNAPAKEGGFHDMDLSQFTLKELDFSRLVAMGRRKRLCVGEEMRKRVLEQLERDVELLRKYDFMDYSTTHSSETSPTANNLTGISKILSMAASYVLPIHGYVSPRRSTSNEQVNRSEVERSACETTPLLQSSADIRSDPPLGLRIDVGADVAKAPTYGVGLRVMDREAEKRDGMGLVPFRKEYRGGIRSSELDSDEYDHEVYYIGIIDILQKFSFVKWLERGIKRQASQMFGNKKTLHIASSIPRAMSPPPELGATSIASPISPGSMEDKGKDQDGSRDGFVGKDVESMGAISPTSPSSPASLSTVEDEGEMKHDATLLIATLGPLLRLTLQVCNVLCSGLKNSYFQDRTLNPPSALNRRLLILLSKTNSTGNEIRTMPAPTGPAPAHPKATDGSQRLKLKPTMSAPTGPAPAHPKATDGSQKLKLKATMPAATNKLTVFVPMPHDRDYPDVRENLRALAGVRKMNFGSGHLFLIFGTEKDAEEGVQIMNESMGLRASPARLDLSQTLTENDDSLSNGTSRLNEPHNILVIRPPNAFPRDQLTKLLRVYPGFEKMEGSRRARFIDAIAALNALEDLNGTTNINANFQRWDEDEETSEDEGQHRKSGKLPKSIEVRGIKRDETTLMEIRDLFSRMRGFVRVAFQPDGVCFVDFSTPEQATRAAARVNTTTKLKASTTSNRPVDPTHFPPSPESSALFVRLEPWFTEEDAREFFSAFDGFRNITFPKPSYGIVLFGSKDVANAIVHDLRKTTNFVVDFAKNDRAFGSDRQKSNQKEASSGPANSSVNSSDAGGGQRRKSRPTSGGSDGKRKEWPGVRLVDPPVGLNVKELFSREKGFLQMVFDLDGSFLGLYSAEEEAREALNQISRLVYSDPTLVWSRIEPRKVLDHVDPSTVIYLEQNPMLSEGQMRRLLQSYEGFQHFLYLPPRTSRTQNQVQGQESVERAGFALARFGSISDAKRALEDIATTTNLIVNFSRRGEDGFDSLLNNSTSGSARKGGDKKPASRKSSTDDTSMRRPGHNGYSSGSADHGASQSTDSPPKRTLHLTSPPFNKAALKRFVIETLNANRIVMKRSSGSKVEDYCFVIFPTVDDAIRAKEKIHSRWPACTPRFARSDYTVEPTLAPGDPSSVLYVVTQYTVLWDELDGLCREYPGYKDLEYDPWHSRVYFKDVASASRALKDLNETTGFQAFYSNIGRKSRSVEEVQAVALDVKAVTAKSKGGRR
ncbi:hypothetical protein HK102_004982, partial [Quaeritorhiza haematococci]